MKTGDNVVCIDVTGLESLYFAGVLTALPVEGETYVIRGVAPGLSLNNTEGPEAVYLEGIVNPCSAVAPFPERGFDSRRFRLLDTMSEAEKEIAREKRDAVMTNI